MSRALQSALNQDFSDFEIIVVDSASTDGTRDVVRAHAASDPRIRLICEEGRRGVCPARNVAIDTACGEWIVPLDSDDELPPGTLAMFSAKITSAPDVAQHRFMCRWDEGSLSPRPPLVEEEWDYTGYLMFLERVAGGGNSETMSCILASTFQYVRFPEDRSYETLYHLDFAARFRTASHVEVARFYHSDATDQNSFVPNPRHWLSVAPDVAGSLERVISRHGVAMARVAPRAFNETLRSAAKFQFLSGNRRRALTLLRELWRRERLSPLSCGILGLGMLGSRPLAWADAFRAYLRRSR